MKKSLVNEKSLVNQVKRCTYINCLECSSYNGMWYDCNNNEYVCEECYKIIHFTCADNDEIELNLRKFQELILNCKTPKKAIKIFIDKILKKDFNNYYIDELLQEIKNDEKCIYFLW